MKLIVAGGRYFNNYPLLKQKIDCLTSGHTIECIICGEARGADSMGRRYAEENNIPILSFPAEWDKYGKSAGYRRNAEMAEQSTHLIAFWDGKSKGTKHMIDIMYKKNLPYRVVRYE